MSFGVRLAECGFFVPPGTPPVGGQFSCVPVAAIEQAVQFFRVEATAERAHGVLVIVAYHPPLDDAAVARIAAALPRTDELVVFMRSDSTGHGAATCGSDGACEVAASAIAAVKVIGGWEAEDWIWPFRIVVDGTELSVETTLADRRWTAHVSRP